MNASKMPDSFKHIKKPILNNSIELAFPYIICYKSAFPCIISTHQAFRSKCFPFKFDKHIELIDSAPDAWSDYPKQKASNIERHPPYILSVSKQFICNAFWKKEHSIHAHFSGSAHLLSLRIPLASNSGARNIDSKLEVSSISPIWFV
jgi:hypothetical protein